MSEQRDYYQVFWDDCPGVVHENLDTAIEDVSESMKVELTNNYETETGEYKIKTIQMTPEEFAALPEFDGY